jgi:cytoskeletal protein RodZ
MGSFGEKLKKEREQRSITLDDIALSTKIGTRMLRALEEEKFEQLPGGIFNKGFVRAYARHLGLDEEQTIADYLTALHENQALAAPTEELIAPIAEPKVERLRHPVQDAKKAANEIPWGLLALALLLVALALASWSYYHRAAEKNKNDSAPAAGVSPTSQGDAGDLGTGVLPRKPAGSGKAPTSPIPTKEQAGGQAGAVSQAALHATGARDVATPAGMFTVVLKGNNESEECWVSIVADGAPPVEATLVHPYEKMIQAKNEVVLKVGSAGALDILFNGRKLPSQGDFGTVRTLTFHADGLQASPARVEASVPPAR